jgi:aspartyl-tRNA(Asn)/glutamyl-tRNA(Gln) amidotransferase subunit C
VRGLSLVVMPLSKDEVRHVAMLARLGLEPGDEAYYAEQLSGILEHIDRRQQLDTEDIPPTAQVVQVASRLREDEPRPSLTKDEALANAPAAVNGMFRVPSIQEET